MYIVVLYTTKGRMYFSGQYILGVHLKQETYYRDQATLLSASQADEVGRAYMRTYGYDFDLERIS